MYNLFKLFQKKRVIRLNYFEKKKLIYNKGGEAYKSLDIEPPSRVTTMCKPSSRV